MSATLAPTTTRPAPVPTLTAAARSLRAEVTRLTSVRSTWWSLAAAATLYLFFAVAFGRGSDGGAPVSIPGEAGLLFVQFALYVPVVLAIAGAYATRSIRTTLQAVPRRGVLLLTRWLVLVAAAVTAAILLALLADGVAAVLLGGLAGAAAGSIISSVAMVGVVVAFGATIAVGLAFTLRSTAGVITAMFLLQLVLPMVLPMFGIEALTTVADHLPGKAMFSLLEAFADPTVLSPARAWAVFAGWSVAAMAAGTWSLLRRDAA